MDREEIFAYAADRFGAQPEYLWKRYPTYAVLRHGSNRKWFAAVLNVPLAKLGLEGEGEIDLLNVKCEPILAGSLLGTPGYLPGYHMNKDNWISIRLDGTAPREDILRLLEISYDLTGPKLPKGRKSDTKKAVKG